jgi:hypothetical protein
MTPFRILRRAAGGAAGGPASMLNAELAYNEQDNILYYGYGTGGAGGTATTALPIGGPGAMAKKDGSNVTGTWGIDISGAAAAVPWSGVSGKPTTLAGFGITDGQPLDGDLTALAALTGTGLARRTGANTWELDASTYLTAITEAMVLTALGFTPENSANKGVANGYASLDSGGKVPSSQLPSFVDDVLEYANLAAFPGAGETGKLYVALDTNKTYRWSGSVYVEITGSPGSTDAVPEGSTNLYFTQARARASVSSAGGLLSYDSGTGVLTLAAIAHTDVSGLGTMATQNANNVNITGGAIDGIVLDGGTF